MTRDRSDHQNLIIGPDKSPKWEDTHKISWKCGMIIFVVVFATFVGIYFIVANSSEDGSVLGAGYPAGRHHIGRGNPIGRGGTSGGGGCFDASSTTVWAKNESESDQNAKEIIIWNDGISYFKRADHVRIGDVMKVRDKLMYVEKIDSYIMKSKVAVETEDGTIVVNDVLASGLCDNNPEAIENIMKTTNLLTKYKQTHFGQKYETTCMDTHSWKSKYFEINGYPVLSSI